MEERRKSARSRTHLGARIVFNGLTSSADCLVRDLSAKGAKIAFGDAAAIPREFEIAIHGRAESHRARMVWRKETQGGLAFVESSPQIHLSLDAACRIRRLEAERDALARRVSELSQ